MTRRGVLALLGSTAVSAFAGAATPLLCLHSKVFAKIGYTELGEIVKQFGFDGVDLTVRPGGHVEPRLSSVDLVRAYESVAGAGLECPMISTALTTPLDPTALAVLAISGRTHIPLFRVGEWPGSTPQYRREIAGLAAIGARYEIAMALHNYTGENSGETQWSVPEVLATLDPKVAGAYFDPIHHGKKWELALRPLLPRLRAIAVKDFKENGAPCPLGEGIVNWDRYFALLNEAAFSGVLSLRVEYAPQDELGAVAKDYAFARARMGSGTRSGSGAGSGSGLG